MNEEKIRKMVSDSFFENIMNNLDSSIIFKYIEGLEKENKQLSGIIDKAINKLGIYADKMIDNGNAYAICVDLLHLLKEVDK